MVSSSWTLVFKGFDGERCADSVCTGTRDHMMVEQILRSQIAACETMVDVVVVFSNERPEIGQLSKDRWKIFQIRDEELLDATERYV